MTTRRYALAALLAALPVAADTSPPVSAFNPSAAAPSRTIEAHRARVNSISIAADARTFATTGADRTVRVWSAATGNELQSIPGSYRGEIVWISPDGKTIVTDDNQSVAVIDARKGARTATVQGTFGFAVSPDGRLIACVSRAGRVALFNAQTGEELRPLGDANRFVCAFAFTKDGRRLAEFDVDGVARVWDVGKGEELFRLEGRPGRASDAQFSPDGMTLAATGQDGALRLFDAATGKETLTERTAGGHRAIAFSRDGRLMATGHNDGTIRLWDTKSWREVRKLSGHAGGVEALAFTPDGRALISGGGDGKLIVWGRVPGGGGPAATRGRKPAYLGVQWDAHGDAQGVVLEAVIPGSAAEKAGLAAGDVILGAGGKDVKTFDELRAVLSDHREGDQIEIRYSRDGKETKAKVTLGARPER